MNYQELRGLVGGSSPQDVSYQDIVSGIQSQYKPQTQFAPTKSLLDTIGALVPEQPRIAYGSLLQAQPRSLPASVDLGSTYKNPNAMASVDSGAIKSIGTDTGKITGNTAMDNTLVYNNNFNNTGSSNLTGVAGNGNNVSATGAVMSGLGVLAGNSDLAKTGVLTNIGGQLLNANSAEDVFKTLGNVAISLSGNAGVAGSLVGGATGNTSLLANSLLSLTSPQLSALNTISNALTGYNFGDIVTGLANAPEGAVDEYGVLGAANLGNLITNTGQNATKNDQSAVDQRTLETLASLGDKDAIAALTSSPAYNPITDLGTATGNSYWNLFTPVGGTSAKITDRQTLGTSLI